MKEFLQSLNPGKLKDRITHYGFSYSTRDYLIQCGLILTAILAVAYFSRMNRSYMSILLAIGVTVSPLLIIAWFRQMYNIRRFTMLCDYLGNIIPVFMQKTKIRYTLGELHDLTSGEMKDCVYRAITYIDETKDDIDLEKNALKIIEQEFENSRLRSVHKLLLGIENTSSDNYQDVCANMHNDIEQWIKRVYVYQKDLKDRRNKLLILCFLTLFMNCLFVYTYVSNEFFSGFTDVEFYQLSTFGFTTAILSVVTLILTKLNGEWLVDDLKHKNEDQLKNRYILYKGFDGRISVVFVLLSLVFAGCGVYLVICGQYLYALICFAMAVLTFYEKKRKRNLAFSKLTKAFAVEFPVWLREISLSLNHLTVLNAIDNSINTVSYPFRQELKEFMKDAGADPTSIRPYTEFLSEYDLEDCRSSMKVLYAIQNVGKEDMKSRVSSLIERNQEMLAKGEAISNEDSLSGVEFIGYLPALLFSLQMMISMFTMFSFMMGSIGRIGSL